MTYVATVVDHNPVYRRGVEDALAACGFYVQEMDEDRRTVEDPDVFVVSASGPRGRGAIRQTRADHAASPIVAIVSSSWDRPHLHAAVVTDGAIAAVPRDAPPAIIASVVHAAVAGWAVLVAPDESIRSFGRLFCGTLEDDPEDLLESDIRLLQMLFEGETRQTLAGELHFAPRTVDRHIQTLYRKLNASGLMDAILRALLWGYLLPPPKAPDAPS